MLLYSNVGDISFNPLGKVVFVGLLIEKGIF